ncbi:unnamed protein product [Microthlaspi erraticum]|uniref:CMP/dCMP-type deaminase domain-containing protein n=1 Tax=Microthlaspi erraticum TaxID=1685480 RepID=A0A6D2KKB3_9BRAS|nr:unnamed protein product [Microthlaspi erraticum]
METEYDQVLSSVAQVKIADQIGDGDGVKVSCFTEFSDDVTLQFQIIRLAKQIYVWVGCNSAKFGNLYAAASTRPSNIVSVTSVLGGTSDNTGSGIARRLVMKTGLNIILACNIPKNNPLLEAKAEKVLIRKLIDLGYTMPTPLRAAFGSFTLSGEANYIVMAPAKEDNLEESHTYMGFALHQAKLALEALEVPVGCVILEDGHVIASGRNRTNETRNATRHAEMEAIDQLNEQWRKDTLSPSQVADKFSNCVLYVTCEPCIMCASALSFLGIKEVYYGCPNDKFGGCGSILPLHLGSSQPSDKLGKGYKCRGGIMADEAVSLFKCFYEQGNPNAPKPHRPVVQREKT